MKTLHSSDSRQPCCSQWTGSLSRSALRVRPIEPPIESSDLPCKEFWPELGVVFKLSQREGPQQNDLSPQPPVSPATPLWDGAERRGRLSRSKAPSPLRSAGALQGVVGRVMCSPCSMKEEEPSPLPCGLHHTETTWYLALEAPDFAVQRSPAFFAIRFWPRGDCGVMTVISRPWCSISRPPFFGPMK